MISENIIQQNLIKLLTAYGRRDICWFAVPNGEKRSRKTAIRLKAQGVIPGVADLILIVDRQSFGLELKAYPNKQSDAQIEWQEQFERAGGIYYLARGFDEAIVVLNRIRAFKTNIVISEAKALAKTSK